MADKRKRCIWGNCKARQHKGSHCETHYPLIRDAVERRRDQHRKTGLCLNCKRPAYKWGLCNKHLSRLKARMAAKRRKRKCLRCGKTGLAFRKRYHAECFREDHLEQHLKWQSTHKRLYRTIHRKASRDYQERHRLNGLCHYCPEPVVPGKGSCKKHLEIARKRYVPVTIDHRRQQWRTARSPQ